jgi:hypothetical protein
MNTKLKQITARLIAVAAVPTWVSKIGPLVKHASNTFNKLIKSGENETGSYALYQVDSFHLFSGRTEATNKDSVTPLLKVLKAESLDMMFCSANNKQYVLFSSGTANVLTVVDILTGVIDKPKTD